MRAWGWTVEFVSENHVWFFFMFPCDQPPRNNFARHSHPQMKWWTLRKTFKTRGR
jgi:hypothetical protein